MMGLNLFTHLCSMARLADVSTQNAEEQVSIIRRTFIYFICVPTVAADIYVTNCDPYTALILNCYTNVSHQLVFSFLSLIVQ